MHKRKSLWLIVVLSVGLFLAACQNRDAGSEVPELPAASGEILLPSVGSGEGEQQQQAVEGEQPAPEAYPDPDVPEEGAEIAAEAPVEDAQPAEQPVEEAPATGEGEGAADSAETTTEQPAEGEQPESPRPEESTEKAQPAAETSEEPSAPQTYTVQQGDTFGQIAERLGVDVQTLADANNIVNPDRIEVGQVLVLPGGDGQTEQPADSGGDIADTPQPEAPAAAAPGEYTVRAGDTINSIAAQFGVSGDALARANGLWLFSALEEGQILTIPSGDGTDEGSPADSGQSEPAPAEQNDQGSDQGPVPAGQTYIVQVGDTIGRIAQRFGVSIDAIVAANNLPNENRIDAGQVLIIPNP